MSNKYKDKKIVVIVPAYNEERFIGSSVIQALKYADIVITVDDGSIDETAEIAEAAGAVVIRHEQNRGKGVALNTGFSKALEVDPSVIVVIDGDGQHRLEEIPNIIKPILNGEADLVIGSRYLETRSKVPSHRILGHWLITLFTNWGSRVRVTDSQSGFRAFSPSAAQCFRLSSDGFSAEAEMQFWAYQHNFVVKEVPVTVYYKDKPKRFVIGQGVTVLNGILRLIGLYRPMLFFGAPGFILLISGIALGGYVARIYGENHLLAVGYALITVLLTILGTLSIFVGIILHSIRSLVTDIIRGEKNHIFPPVN